MRAAAAHSMTIIYRKMTRQIIDVAEINVKYRFLDGLEAMGLMNSICRTVTIFIVMMLSNGAVLAKEECYYNPDVINYNYFLEHTGFAYARWDHLRKEARITLEEEGEEVFIGYSACETFGLTAELRMKKSPEKLKAGFLVDKLKWLGKKTLERPDYDLLVKVLNEKKFIEDLKNIVKKERVSIGVEDTDYQSFRVYVVHDKNDFLVGISWYM